MKADMEPIDFLIARVADRLQNSGKSERQASLDATGSPDALRYIRTRRAMPSPVRLAAIAAELDTSEDFLLGRTDDKRPRATPLTTETLLRTLGHNEEAAAHALAAEDRRQAKNASIRLKQAQLPDDIPVLETEFITNSLLFGDEAEFYAVDGFTIFTGISFSWFTRHPKIFQDESVYGFYLPTVALEPAFQSGSPAIASKKRTAAVGDYVVIYLNKENDGPPFFTDTCVMAKLIEATSSALTIETHNPANRGKIQRSRIASIDRVFTHGDFLT